MSPSSTPSPKKRQLPSIPLEAQMKSRDRGILNVKLEPSVYSLTPPFHGFRGAMYSFAISTNVCHHLKNFKYHSTVKLWYTLYQTLKGHRCFYAPVFKTGRIMVYQCPSVRPSVSHVTL